MQLLVFELTTSTWAQAYTKCAPLQHEENKHVKVVANTRYTLAAGPDPHTFLYVEGKYAVTENFVRVDGAKSVDVSENKVSTPCLACALIA